MGSDTRKPITRQIPVRTHGHYLVEAPEGAGPFPLLVGFHGYGETAEDHLRQLAAIPGGEGFLRCAVQGLHLFYARGGRDVVASWMTRLNRELAITDNTAYAGAVVARLKEEFPASERLVFSGFSQGVAMAYRAAAGAGHPCGGLIALAGDVPPEIRAPEVAARLPPVLLGRGEGDAWYTAEKMEQDLATLRAAGVRAEAHVFPGGHEWTEGFRRKCGEFLRDIAAS